jgi:parvulin-like peptidyl-prolyl isomerase
MTFLRLAVGATLAVAWVTAQEDQIDTAGVKPDSVVAVMNGKKYTAEQVQRLVAAIPSAQAQSAFRKDPKQFLRDHAFYLVLQQWAEEHKLDQQSPYKETIEFGRMFTLANAALNVAMQQVDVDPGEVKTTYESTKENYREARIRMIYIGFSDAKSEAAARIKAATAAKRAAAGEDFKKLVKEYSEDPGSKAQDGDPGFVIRLTSEQPPEAMRKPILAGKAGQVLEPLRHDNGYYLIRVESNDVLPFEKVQQEIYLAIRDKKFREWQDSTKAKATVQFENEAFFQNIGKEK